MRPVAVDMIGLMILLQTLLANVAVRNLGTEGVTRILGAREQKHIVPPIPRGRGGARDRKVKRYAMD